MLQARPTLLLSLALLASKAAGDRIDEIVRDEMRTSKTPGVSLVVLRKGRIAKLAGYGLANVEDRAKVDPDTVFQCGSITKMFTAAAILRLVEEGRLSLDDPLSKFLPEAPPSWSAIRLRHLLSHTAGLPDFVAHSIGLDPNADYTIKEALAQVAKRPLDFPVGEAWSYSNTGYLALGAVLEAVTGKGYADAMRDMVFAPLGMRDTRINDIYRIVPKRAAGYLVQDGELMNGDREGQSFSSFPDGGMITTVRDLAKWEAAIVGNKLLRPASWDLMMTRGRLDSGRRLTYGFAWFVRPALGKRIVDHGGNSLAFNADIYRDVTAGTTVIVLANAEGLSARHIAERIAQEALPETRGVPSQAAKPTAAIEAKIRSATESWLTGKPDGALFSPDFRLSWNSDRLKATLRAAAKMGTIKGWTYLESTPDEDETIHVYRMETDKGTYRVTATVLADGSIGGFGVSRLQ